MVVRIADVQALKGSSVTIDETAEFFMNIHKSSKSALNIFSVPKGTTHSVQKICAYINIKHYFECIAEALEGQNAFVVYDTQRTIH